MKISPAFGETCTQTMSRCHRRSGTVLERQKERHFVSKEIYTAIHSVE